MRRPSDMSPSPVRRCGRPRGHGWRRGFGSRRIGIFLLVAGWAPWATAAASADLAPRGLPFLRSYSFDEIENVNAGARLSFDAFGRVAVVYPGAYAVLNGTNWLDIEGKDAGEIPVAQVVGDGHGHFYYGAYGSWGTIDFG